MLEERLEVGLRRGRNPARDRSGPPASLRYRLAIEPGDKLRWDTDDAGNLSVEIVRQRYGAFEGDDLKALMDGDGQETHELAGHEEDPTFTENA